MGWPACWSCVVRSLLFVLFCLFFIILKPVLIHFLHKLDPSLLTSTFLLSSHSSSLTSLKTHSIITIIFILSPSSSPVPSSPSSLSSHYHITHTHHHHPLITITPQHYYHHHPWSSDLLLLSDTTQLSLNSLSLPCSRKLGKERGKCKKKRRTEKERKKNSKYKRRVCNF